MRDLTAEKFRMMWLKLYFYKARGGCCKTICEVAWANAIFVKFKGVSIKLAECGLDYILILIKFEGFFVKLSSHYILIFIKFGVFFRIAETIRAIRARSDGRDFWAYVAQWGGTLLGLWRCGDSSWEENMHWLQMEGSSNWNRSQIFFKKKCRSKINQGSHFKIIKNTLQNT